MKIFEENDCFKVKIEYSEVNLENIRSVGDGKWEADKKLWKFPLDKREKLLLLKRKYEKDTILLEKIQFQDETSRLKRYLTLKGYSPRTLKSYMGHFERFLQYSNGKIDKQIIDNYIIYLLEEKRSSHSYANQAINSIKAYLRINDNLRGIEPNKIIRPRREQKLPKVMSKEEVRNIIEYIKNPKHKTMIMLAYSCGLRVSEVAELKVRNIDSSRMVVNIVQGKGRKDRIATLSDKMLSQLRLYYKEYHPKEWLFESPDRENHIHSKSIQNVFNDAVKGVGISKKLSFHSLRHSYATHMLESGVDLRYIQELLGHKSSKTTEIYTHVSTRSLSKIPNPLDLL